MTTPATPPSPPSSTATAPRPWWKASVIYQIYPRSFQDSDGDGIGDLRGISARLDDLHDLGVDVVWLCPIYPSPNVDGGYDISDYRGVAPEFGTLADWEALLAGLHARGMRLIMDLVVNHTSDQHPWFQASRQSQDNPYRDYYHWRPGRDGGPPSNWGSHFGGSAWTQDDLTGEYYLHLFAPGQPDLNWENPRVRQEVYDLMRFWLERGIDGFRIDTANMFSKTPGYPDVPAAPGQPYPLASKHFIGGPRLLEFLHEMKEQVLPGTELLTVGETPDITPEDALTLTRAGTGPLSMVFAFDHLNLDMDPTHPTPKWTRVPWSLVELKGILSRWQHTLHGEGWNSQFLSNHDVPRLVSRFGDDGVHRVASAKLFATLLFTLQGTPYIYQGDEIGMTNVAFESIEDYRDVDSLNYAREQRQAGRADADILAVLAAKSRDNARTPMQWDDDRHCAGFTSGTPWIGLNPNYPQINVQAARRDPDSIYHHYRTLIRLRRQYPVFVDGAYDLLLPDHPQVYAFTRTTAHEQLLVILNVGPQTVELPWPGPPPLPTTTLLLGNRPAAAPPEAQVHLQPYEARVYHTRREPGDAMT